MIITDGINHGKLQSIIVGELKKAGFKHRLKKIILKTVKDHKTIFGAPLLKVPSSAVICCGSTISIPMVVIEMSSVLRANANIEGLFRKAGSQTRQKDIKRLLDAGGCVSDGHHPIDVASVLKLYLRCLPEPLISAEVQDLLLRCRLSGGEDSLQSILHTLLLLPVLQVHLLHYIMELLNFISSRHKENLMDSTNLAIVMAPSIMPLPETASTHRLEHHVALVKLFIENAKYIGILTDDLMSQLDDDSDIHHAKRKKRRSGSLNRVLSGLRKMVTGAAHTPVAPRELNTPVIKSAAKRKFNSYEGLSAKTKKDIKQKLPQKELSFTPMKMGFERKRLRLSLVGAVSTPSINAEISKTSETSANSADLLTSTEHLFKHDTIDLSPDMRARTDYVRISKREYEEIKHRVERIEHRLSREFTDVTNTQQVQDAYEQTLEDVASLHCPTSEHLARRLSRELKIRPSEHAGVIRSPSARRIGTIRRRSKENVRVVRHASWSSTHSDRFYPYGASRQRTDLVRQSDDWDASLTETSPNTSASSHKYRLRQRASVGSDCNLNRCVGRPQARRSPRAPCPCDASDKSSSTLDSSSKSNSSQPNYQNINRPKGVKSPSAQKWRSAAAFFMDKTGETDASGASGRPSVNKLRRNAGAVLAKAKLFESGSDASSERRLAPGGFARRPRAGQSQSHARPAAPLSARLAKNLPPVPVRTGRQNLQPDRQKTPPIKKVVSPHRTPAMKKSLCTPRGLRSPAAAAAAAGGDARRPGAPLRAPHALPRRRSPRHKLAGARCPPD